MKEIWKDIIDYKGLYKVSNFGRIKRLPKKVTNNFGTFISKEIILKGSLSQYGYVKQTLTKNGKADTYLVHRIVAQAFLTNFDNKEMVNHINGIKHDNNLFNLEWVTSSENMRHALDTKLLIPRNGSRIYFSKFTEKDVSIILYKNLVNGNTSNQIAKELNTNKRTISDMVKSRTWKHVSCPDILTNEDIEYYNKLVLEGNIKSKINAKLKTHKFDHDILKQVLALLE